MSTRLSRILETLAENMSNPDSNSLQRTFEYCAAYIDGLDAIKEKSKMASRIMCRSEAEKYIHENGYKLFLDMCEKERLLVLPDRQILPLYKEHGLSGVVELETWSDMGLTLKINDTIVYQHNK